MSTLSSPPPATTLLGQAMTLREAVTAMTSKFAAGGIDTPSLDARRLTRFLLGLDDLSLLREPERALSAEDRARLEAAMRRRLDHEPVSRILGERGFHGLDLEIGASTLDPRPDTETLVDAVLELARDGELGGVAGAPRILDLGTGSGAILLALLQSLPGSTGLGIDISGDAIAVATRNADRLGLADRGRFRQSSWLDSVTGEFDVVVSNPPYIPSADLAGLEPEVRLFDPPAALDGGPDGLDAYRKIVTGVSNVMAPSAWLAVEIGAGQCDAVAAILSRAVSPGMLDACRTWKDLSGIVRCVAAKARN